MKTEYIFEYNKKEIHYVLKDNVETNPEIKDVMAIDAIMKKYNIKNKKDLILIEVFDEATNGN